MKQFLFITMALLLAFNSSIIAQEDKPGLFKRIKDRAKGTTEQRAENAGDKVGNKVGDKVDNAVDSLLSGAWFKKKKKKKEDNSSATGNNGTNNGSNKTSSGNNNGATENGKAEFKAYSKFDFVPGAKVIAYEDFSQDNIGDFPAKWNTNSSGEVVKLEGANDKFLMCNGDGLWYPEFLNDLPENATIEFDLVAETKSHMQTHLNFVNTTINKNLLNYGFEGLVQVIIDANGGTEYFVNNLQAEKISNNAKDQHQYKVDENEPGTFAHISIWKQKTRLRIYLNEEKIWDIPRAFDETQKYKLVIGSNTFFQENRKFYLANLREAVGAPDTRNKLITDGKFVTNGILFEFQKAAVKPESYGIIKEIATVLKENPTIKVKVVGHTSNDGDANANITLSKQRAAAVKEVLVSEFGIDASRLETDGKGGAEPIDTSNTPTGKANNRRVEFIKL